MGYLSHAVIRFLLNIERICLEAVGSGFHGLFCSRALKGILYAGFLVAINAMYYFIHFQMNREEEGEHQDTLDIQFVIDALASATIISFPFAGPLHRALGYFGDDPLLLQELLALLTKDAGTSHVISLVLCCFVSYTMGEILYFDPTIPAFSWQFVYYPLVVMTTLIFYGNLLLAILTMRVFLVRLFAMEEQVKEALLTTDPLPGAYHTFASSTTAAAENNGTSIASSTAHQHADYQPQDEERAELSQQASLSNSDGASSLRPTEWVVQWTQQYRILRQHVHDVSHAFGFRLLLGLFLFAVDTTAMIAVLWEELGPEMGVRGVTALLLSFCSNSFLITGTLYSAAYLVMECSHHIGPKLAILAVRLHGECPQLQVLASAFLHAPVKVHVGIFEVSPEYASAMGLWFLGLFLVVFGLKIPGEV